MGALDGILVVAIEQAVAAPLCTARLADAGARVIKIERQGGETARHYDAAVKGTSTYFTWLNRGKESVVLNLKDKTDLKLVHRMLKQADILVQNLAPGALARMGFTTELIETEFPQLITASIVGYGQDTDYADMRAYDLLVQAEAGICALTGSEDSPAKVGVPIADIGTGINAHAAILEALIARGRTGRGKQIEISMFDSMADWNSVPILQFEHQESIIKRHGMAHAAIYPYGPFDCADGTILIAVQTQREWESLCECLLNNKALATHTDFATNPKRAANRQKLDKEMIPIISAMSVASAKARLKEAGIAHAQVTDIDKLGSHPALRRTTVTLADGRPIQIPRPAGRQTDKLPDALPAIGAHTTAIKKEFG